jgi:hypothetical protein
MSGVLVYVIHHDRSAIAELVQQVDRLGGTSAVKVGLGA